jgi:L-glutamine:2-deoxy-scyllo-inosose/3-amino-2,3-dideoxy-scyllo-inosose aminotransferase
MRIARRHKLKVVEDVAHQHGSRWRGKGAGAIGDAGSFSFQQSKVLTSGEGGAVTCNDRKIYETVFALKQVGWGTDGKPANRYGHNYRITEMQAALLRGGLRRLPEQTRRREQGARYLAAGLAKIGGPLSAAPRDPRVTRQAYYTMTMKFDPALAGGVTKKEYIEALKAERCQLLTTYAPVYSCPLLNLYDSTSPVPYRDQRRIQDYRKLKLPNVERAVKATELLLMHYHLLGSHAYLDQLLGAIAKVNDHLGEVKKLCRKKAGRKKQA